MDCFNVKTELGKTERKKPKPRRAVVLSDDDDAFVKVEDQVARAPAPPPGGKRCRPEPRQQKPSKKPNPFDEYCLPDDALASIPLP